jgi:hypothetical protein
MANVRLDTLRVRGAEMCLPALEVGSALDPAVVRVLCTAGRSRPIELGSSNWAHSRPASDAASQRALNLPVSVRFSKSLFAS